MEVDIYIITSRSAPRAGPGRYISVLEYQECTKTLKEGFESITPHTLELLAILDSLKRFKKPCGIRIHSLHGWYRSVTLNGWIDKWKAAGWINKDKPVANADLYRDILDTQEKLNLEVLSIDDNLGTYDTWLKNEIERSIDENSKRSM